MKKSSALGWLWKNSKTQRFNILLLMLANAGFSVLSVFFALAVKIVVDGAVSANKETLIKGVIALIVVIILQFLFRIICKSLQAYINGKLTITFRRTIIGEVLRKKYSVISKYHSGELLNHISSDVDVICEGITDIVPEVFGSVVRLVCAIGVLFTINLTFALAFVVAGVLLFIVSMIMRKKIKFYHRKMQFTEGKTRAYLQENIENLLAVKVFSAENQVAQKADSLQKNNFSYKMKGRNFSVFGHASFNLIASCGYAFALIYGGLLIFNGTGFGYGDLSAVLQLVNSVQMPFMSLSSVFPKYYTMIASAERILTIEGLENEGEATPLDYAKIYEDLKSINVENLTFAYEQETVLENVNLTINKGDTVAIIGGSGKGKTTLFKLLLGVYEATSGEAYLLSNEKIKLDFNTRKMFCYVPQGNYIFSGSIEENLRFINQNATAEQIDEALELCQIKEVIYALPEGLKTVVGENGQGLSEGQLQRIAIARALLSGAPIMLLDEVTSALDENTERKVLDNIKKLKNKTIIIVTHKKPALDICDRVISVQDKRVKYI